jgi:hypothetical protein
VTPVIVRITLVLLVLTHVAREGSGLVVAQVAVERAIVVEAVAKVPELRAIVTGQTVAEMVSGALAVRVTAVALVAEILPTPPTVGMAVALIGLLMVMPMALILAGAGAVEARRQKQNAGGQDCRQDTFCLHGSSS